MLPADLLVLVFTGCWESLHSCSAAPCSTFSMGLLRTCCRVSGAGSSGLLCGMA